METLFDLETETALTKGLSPEVIFCLRAKRRSILLANSILDENGDLIRLEETITLLENQGYILGANSYNDGDITQHFLRVLKALQSTPALVHQLKSFGLPVCNVQLEEMIVITLDIEDEITDRHVIWAVLSALLCPLRQSVGSCFATAPAILIHEEQMEQFLDDMQNLLSKGQLNRIFGGVESIVPMSPSPGIGALKKEYQENHVGFTKALSSIGVKQKKKESHQTYLEVLEELLFKNFNLKKKDLNKRPLSDFPKLEKIEQMQKAMRRAKWNMVAFTDHLLLKMWEFTLASFVDVKTEFSRWNLFSSLGLHAEEKGGIGELVYRYLGEKLDEANEKLTHYQIEYEITFDQVRATERLLKGVSSEIEGRRLKAEHQARAYHMYTCQELRDKYHDRAQNIANFYTVFLEKIIGKFQEYFQEVYDAEMQEVKGSQYDDSPAGFRLLYKHGRTHVGSWTFIHSRDEYIQALKEFFLSIEHPLIQECEWKGGKEELPHLITAIVHHIRSEGFIVSAFYRMAKAHRVPLKKVSSDQLDEMEKKPWAYTSGGALPTLLKTYFKREGSLSEEARWVASPQELAIFLIEIFKLLPPRITDPFLKEPHKRMLMTSPTHAFSLLPGQELFRKGWEDPGFTYTWIRDQIVLPRQAFYKGIRLHLQEQLYLLEKLSDRLPLLEGYDLQHSFEGSEKPLTVSEFRKKLPLLPEVDAFLFEMLPLIPPLKGGEMAKKLNLEPPLHLLGRREFHDELISALPFCHAKDVHVEIASLMESRHLAPPKPLLFADTNWAKFFFSFIVNPATGKLELWRTDKLGLTGAPMNNWEIFLNGAIKEAWGIFLRPFEYTS